MTSIVRSSTRLLVAILFAALLTACGDSSTHEPRPSVLMRGLNAEPESLDPQLVRSVEAMTVLRDIGEGLLSYDASGALRSGVASRWEVSGDGLVYKFHLRPEARWSNGNFVTAQDFVVAFKRLVDPKTMAFYGDLLSSIEAAPAILSGALPPDRLGVEAQDDRTLEIRLHVRTPYFLQLLAHPVAFPIHHGRFEEHGNSYASSHDRVFNGAYRLDDWSIGAEINLSRNEQYWDNAQTSIDAVRYLIIVDPMSELQHYRAGGLHITATVPATVFATLVEERPDELRVSQALAVYYYGFNLSKPPFANNPKLRQALSMAIDREVLTETIIGRGERPAYGWVPPGVKEYTAQRFGYETLDKVQREFHARRLYREAGYGPDNPLEFELRYNSSTFEEMVALAIQSMWRDVLGAEVKLIAEDFRALLSNIEAGELTQLFRLSWGGDYNDANAFLKLMETDNQSNMTGYENADFDRLMTLAMEEADPIVRRRYLEKAEEVVLRDHPVIPIYFYINKHLVRPDVSGWNDNVLDIHLSRYLRLGQEGVPQ